MHRFVWVLVFATVSVVAVVGLVSSGAWDSWDSYAGFLPDIAADKFTTVAAFDGSDPYAPMDELAARYGHGRIGHAAPAPRAPGSFIVHAPLLLVGDVWLLRLMAPLLGAIVATCAWGAVRIAGVDERWALLPVAALVVSPLFVGWLIWASATMIVPALLVAGWLLHKSHPRAAGVLIGVAAAVKLWPGLLIVALLIRRHRAGTAALVSAGGLTLVGLALPGATVSGTIGALAGASAHFIDHSTNLSALAAFGWLGAAAGLALFVWGLFGSTDRLIASAVVAGLMLSPLSWTHYWLAALPVAALGLGWLVRSVPVGDRPGDTEDGEDAGDRAQPLHGGHVRER